MSRGLRNYNPGNIRLSRVKYQGEVTPSQDKSFKQFQTMAWGYRAMFVVLDSYHRKGFKTIRQMINRYAPPVENHTDNYVNFVSVNSGTPADQILDPESEGLMIPIISAMSYMENGHPAVYEEVAEGWRLFRKHRP